MMYRFASFALVSLAFLATSARAYVEAPMSLGAIIAQSHSICLMQITKVDKTQNMIIYQKIQDIKGKHPQEVIKHTIKAELKPGQIKEIMNWAEPGKLAVFFHNTSSSETCTGLNWYQAYPQGEWWGMSHGEPFLLRSYAGKAEKLPALIAEILAGKEVLASCMVDGNKDDLHRKTARIQRLKVSLKILDYNPKRDFSGWGGEDIRKLAGMPGFSQFAALGKVDAEGRSVTPIDFDGDGKLDLCLSSTSRVLLLQNQGDSFSEVYLPGLTTGSRSTVWADYNRDGRPDVLLATVLGPKLYTNLGGGQFRDDTAMLPAEKCHDLTGAAWIDADGDGQMDILLANGFHGLRLYRNKLLIDAATKTSSPQVGPWHYIGPFDNTGQIGFAKAYPPEQEVDLKKEYPGRGGNIGWKPGAFTDGVVNTLALFKNEFNSDSVVYLTREIESAGPAVLPVSMGSDDTLTVWLNGERLLAVNETRAVMPDQHKLDLKLKAGKNTLLLKVCQGGGEWAFQFAVGQAQIKQAGTFEDVSAAWGLGQEIKGGTLAVADFDGDGKPDFLFGAGRGMLYHNTGERFELQSGTGLDYEPRNTGPVFADFDGDSHLDCFIPQATGSKLYRNTGNGKFVDVAAQAGDLAKSIPGAVSAAWGDFNNDGKLDLVVGCLRGPNRYFENQGDGKFTEQGVAIGLHQRIFNTQAVGLADLNNDGKLDLILVNEGQDSAILFGSRELPGKNTPVVVNLGESTGSRLQVLNGEGKPVAGYQITGSEARGGQASLAPRFTLPAGAYKLAIRTSAGKTLSHDFQVADSPLQLRIGLPEPVAPKK